MKRTFKPQKKSMFNYDTYEGETIETKCARIVANNEPITDGAPIVYTEKKDGVRPEFDIRTDRWEIAQETMDKVHAAKIAKAEQKPNEQKPSEQKPSEQKPSEQKPGE